MATPSARDRVATQAQPPKPPPVKLEAAPLPPEEAGDTTDSPAWIALASDEEGDLQNELADQLAGAQSSPGQLEEGRTAARSRSPGARAAVPTLETRSGATPEFRRHTPKSALDIKTEQYLKAQAAVRMCRAKFDAQFRRRCLLDDFPAAAFTAAAGVPPAPAPSGPQPGAAGRRRAYRRYWERQASPAPLFVPAEQFDGAWQGFFFGTGAQGLGYYLDLQGHTFVNADDV